MKKLSAFKWLIALLYVYSFSAWADTEEDGRFWLNINAQGALPVENWSWFAEIQPRWKEEGREFDQLLIRPAVLYKLSKQSSVGLGYAHVTTHKKSGNQEENRLWQQFTYNFEPIEAITLQSRTRLEQRHMEDASDTAHRLRQMLRVTRPFAANPAVSLVMWDEVMFNFNDTDWGARSGFDQNRLFLGASWQVNRAKIEVGYINQYINASKIDKENHVFSTTLGFDF